MSEPHKGSLEFYARCERERRAWESLADTARRLLYEDAISAFGGNTTHAAAFIGMSQQGLEQQMDRYRALKVEADLGNATISKHKARINIESAYQSRPVSKPAPEPAEPTHTLSEGVVVPIKRPPGRPKGSKNRPKTMHTDALERAIEHSRVQEEA